MENKNQKLLKSFTEYCNKYPEERFWQALRNWSGVPFIFASNYSAGSIQSGIGDAGIGWIHEALKDTFYWDDYEVDKI